jgi:hypothetical protein
MHQYFIYFYCQMIFHCQILHHLLFSHYLMDIWVVFYFLSLMNNGTIKHFQVFQCGSMFSFLLDIYLGMELLSHLSITPCLTFWGTAKLFPTVVAQFYIPTGIVWEFLFLCVSSQQILVIICFFMIDIWSRIFLSCFQM